MKAYHLYFLCALIFYLTAIVAAISDPALLAVFLAIAGGCATFGVVLVGRERDEDR